MAPATGDLTPAGLAPFDLVLATKRVAYQINYSSHMATVPGHVHAAVRYS